MDGEQREKKPKNGKEGVKKTKASVCSDHANWSNKILVMIGISLLDRVVLGYFISCVTVNVLMYLYIIVLMVLSYTVTVNLLMLLCSSECIIVYLQMCMDM